MMSLYRNHDRLDVRQDIAADIAEQAHLIRQDVFASLDHKSSPRFRSFDGYESIKGKEERQTTELSNSTIGMA